MTLWLFAVTPTLRFAATIRKSSAPRCTSCLNQAALGRAERRCRILAPAGVQLAARSPPVIEWPRRPSPVESRRSRSRPAMFSSVLPSMCRNILTDPQERIGEYIVVDHVVAEDGLGCVSAVSLRFLMSIQPPSTEMLSTTPSFAPPGTWRGSPPRSSVSCAGGNEYRSIGAFTVPPTLAVNCKPDSAARSSKRSSVGRSASRKYSHQTDFFSRRCQSSK